MVTVSRIKVKFPQTTVQKSLRAGNFKEAVVTLQAHLRAHARDHAAWHQLALAHTQSRKHAAALEAVNQAIALAPHKKGYQRDKGIMLANAGSNDAAIAILLPCLYAQPDDHAVMVGLQIAYYKSGKHDHAIALGRKILQMENRAAIKRALPSGMPPSSQRRGYRKMIAFSLWGANRVYNYGAMVNARLAPFIYPGWKCRFYLGADVPAATRSMLVQSGAEIIEAHKRHADVVPAMWRFLIADDPNVSIFLCRDCDARLTPKEAAAVDMWLRSGRRAHVMRDHSLHRNLMLAGMWGATTEQPLSVAQRMKRFSAGNTDARYGIDQRFLALEIWPEIREDCLIHDSYYDLFGAQPFPVMGKGSDWSHVGMGIVTEAALRREAQVLGLPWQRSSRVVGSRLGLRKNVRSDSA